MPMKGSLSVGVPIKILHEAEGHIVTVETTDGLLLRGKLIEAEDNMNCQLASVSAYDRNGSQSMLETCFIRGSKIRFMILPDMLRNAPMFRRMAGQSSTPSLRVSRRGMIPGFPGLRGRGRGGRGRGGSSRGVEIPPPGYVSRNPIH